MWSYCGHLVIGLKLLRIQAKIRLAFIILLHHAIYHAIACFVGPLGSVDPGLRNLGLALVARNENSLVFQI